VGVAVAALLVGLGVRLVDDARRLAVRGLHDLGLRDQPGLLGAALLDGPVVGVAAGLDHALGFGSRAFGEVVVLGLSGGHGALGLGLRVGDELFGASPGLGDEAFGLGVGLRHGPFGLLVRARDGRVGLGARGLHDLVALVEHVLGVVDLGGQRFADVVEQFEGVPARHHA